MNTATGQGEHRGRGVVAALVFVLLVGTAAMLPLLESVRADEPLPSHAKAPIDLASTAGVPRPASGRAEPPLRREVSRVVEPTEAPRPVGLRGRIVDANGAGVGDAVVQIDFVASSVLRESRRVVMPVATDRDGVFTMAEPAPHLCELHVVHRDYALGCFPVDLRSGPVARDLGTLTLPRGGEVLGRLVDDAGNGIGGATVTLEAERAQPLTNVGCLTRYLPPQPTDAFGYYRVPHIPPGAWRIRAVASRCTDATTLPFDVVDGRQQEVPDLRLSPGHDLAGTVVDGNRRPIAFADVATHGIGAQATVQRVTRTDAAGRFALVGLPAGPLRLLVASEGFEAFRQEGVDPGAGQDAFVVLARAAVGDGGTGLASGSR